jgi:hypothetical protein
MSDILPFGLYKEKRGIIMNREYYMSLLEGRATRLTELIKCAASPDLICNEAFLIMKAALAMKPAFFRKNIGNLKEPEVNESQNERIKCATG